jgi:hypothetical protein
MEDSSDVDGVARLCVEYWKLMQASLRAADQLPEKDGKRLIAQVKFSDLQIKKHLWATRVELSFFRW